MGRRIAAAVWSPRSLAPLLTFSGVWSLRGGPDRFSLNPAALLAAVDGDQLYLEIRPNRCDRPMPRVDVLQVAVALLALHAFQVGLSLQWHTWILRPLSAHYQR